MAERTEFGWRPVLLGQRREERLAWMAETDSDGIPLEGASQYRIRFAPSTEPPARGCWWIAAYDHRYLPVENPLRRYTIGDRHALAINPDGTLDIVVGHVSPGPDLETNWLPSPRDAFSLVLNIVYPQLWAVEGAWAPPAVALNPTRPAIRLVPARDRRRA